jgi:hypothetical protein
MKKLLLCALLGATLSAFAATKNVAVIESIADVTSGANKSVNAGEIRYITQEIRRQAVNNLPRDAYAVMTEQTGQAQGKTAIELGSKIGADIVVQGTIGKFADLFTLSIEAYDTQKGMLVASSDPIESDNVQNLLKEIRKSGPMFFARMSDRSTPTPVQTAKIATATEEASLAGSNAPAPASAPGSSNRPHDKTWPGEYSRKVEANIDEPTLANAFQQAVKEYFKKYDGKVDETSLSGSTWYGQFEYDEPGYIILTPQPGGYLITIKWTEKHKKGNQLCKKWGDNLVKQIAKFAGS